MSLEIDSQKLGENIKELREAHGVTRNELTHVLGITYSAISNYENGIRVPGLEVLRKISYYFGVPIEQLTTQTSFRIPFKFPHPPEGIIPLAEQRIKKIALENESLNADEEVSLRTSLTLYRSSKNK